jgi:DNA-binding CsgD family transcriptional regulator
LQPPPARTIRQVTGLPKAIDAPTFAGVTFPADPSDPDVPRPLRGMLIVVLGLVVIGGITDIVLDRPESLFSAHILVELGLVVLSLGTAIVLWRGWQEAGRELGEARAELDATRRSLGERQAELDSWKERAEASLTGLGEAIGGQLAAWGLTPAEAEVALGLLKGLGHKEIAGRSGRSERTVRQHAVAVYQKAGLGGRAELAAFFLGELRIPGTDRPSDPVYSRLPKTGP